MVAKYKHGTTIAQKHKETKKRKKIGIGKRRTIVCYYFLFGVTAENYSM